MTDDLFSWNDKTDAYSRRSDPETSHAAAESIKPTKLEAIVLETLKTFGKEGATTHELGDALGLGRDTVSPRMPPLIRKGYVIATELRRKGPSGRSCIVFRANA